MAGLEKVARYSRALGTGEMEGSYIGLRMADSEEDLVGHKVDSGEDLAGRTADLAEVLAGRRVEKAVGLAVVRILGLVEGNLNLAGYTGFVGDVVDLDREVNLVRCRTIGRAG